MKLLTITIPSYNTEQFIEKNMKYFLDERLYKKVEILLINDGSTDKTAEKAARYEKKYKNYIRVINKENGGHGSVINRGIREAEGKYFKVIDADDWVSTDNLVKLVSVLEKLNADVVVNPYIKVDQQTGKELLISSGIVSEIGKEVPFEKLLKDKVKLALHSVTYKTELLREHELQLTEKCFYEDFQYILYPIPYIKTAVVLKFPVYYYLVGQAAQSVNSANAFKNIDMYIRIYSESVKYYEDMKGNVPEIRKKYMEEMLCIFLRSLYNIYLRNGNVMGARAQMLKTDRAVKSISIVLYNLMESHNRYIRLIRTGNPLCFSIISFIFRVYKKKQIS